MWVDWNLPQSGTERKKMIIKKNDKFPISRGRGGHGGVANRREDARPRVSGRRRQPWPGGFFCLKTIFHRFDSLIFG